MTICKKKDKNLTSLYFDTSSGKKVRVAKSDLSSQKISRARKCPKTKESASRSKSKSRKVKSPRKRSNKNNTQNIVKRTPKRKITSVKSPTKSSRRSSPPKSPRLNSPISRKSPSRSPKRKTPSPTRTPFRSNEVTFENIVTSLVPITTIDPNAIPRAEQEYIVDSSTPISVRWRSIDLNDRRLLNPSATYYAEGEIYVDKALITQTGDNNWNIKFFGSDINRIETITPVPGFFGTTYQHTTVYPLSVE